MAFRESSEQCRVAIDEGPNIPEVGAWLALIDKDLSMEHASRAEPCAAAAREGRGGTGPTLIAEEPPTMARPRQEPGG